MKTIVGWAGLGYAVVLIKLDKVVLMYPNSKVGYNNLTHAHTYLLFRVLPRKQVRFFFIVCIYI